MDYQALRTELLTDPVSLDYAGTTDREAADLLNSTATGRTLPRDLIRTWEMKESIVMSEYMAATNAQRQWLDMILAGDAVNNKLGNIRTGLLSVFGAGTQTRANLAALQAQTVSRAVELGLGVVSPGDVSLARSGNW